MPHIPQTFINSVFYLYRSVQDARNGSDPAGTGFIIEYGNDEAFQKRSVYYGVSNWHVVCKDGASVIRLNTKSGGTDIIELGPEEWTFVPGKHDIAAIKLNLDPDIHASAAISIDSFVDVPQNKLMGPSFGVGEDVFMIGLFVDHYGKGINIPSARFGNVSMLPDKRAKIIQPTGYNSESVVVDMHSRTGFSGSPVFVYRTFGSDFTSAFGEHFDSLEIYSASFELERRGTTMSKEFEGRLRGGTGRIKHKSMLKLLGIHWGQFPEMWKVKAGLPDEVAAVPQGDTSYVQGLSGMTMVIPAWFIKEVLDLNELKEPRDSYFKEGLGSEGRDENR